MCGRSAQSLVRTHEGAFYSAELDITSETVGRSSPYHTLSGVHWVRACVSHAMADVVGFDEACQGVAFASQDLSANPDLTLGRAGTLLAYSSLVDLGGTVPSCRSFFCERGRR